MEGCRGRIELRTQCFRDPRPPCGRLDLRRQWFRERAPPSVAVSTYVRNGFVLSVARLHGRWIFDHTMTWGGGGWEPWGPYHGMGGGAGNPEP